MLLFNANEKRRRKAKENVRGRFGYFSDCASRRGKNCGLVSNGPGQLNCSGSKAGGQGDPGAADGGSKQGRVPKPRTAQGCCPHPVCALSKGCCKICQLQFGENPLVHPHDPLTCLGCLLSTLVAVAVFLGFREKIYFWVFWECETHECALDCQ